MLPYHVDGGMVVPREKLAPMVCLGTCWVWDENMAYLQCETVKTRGIARAGRRMPVCFINFTAISAFPSCYWACR